MKEKFKYVDLDILSHAMSTVSCSSYILYGIRNHSKVYRKNKLQTMENWKFAKKKKLWQLAQGLKEFANKPY